MNNYLSNHFRFLVLGDECNKDSDCFNLENSYCGDSNNDTAPDSCICKPNYSYDFKTDGCVKPVTKDEGNYKDKCSLKRDCKSPLDCRKDKCLCPRGYRYITKLNKCKKGIYDMLYSDLCLIRSKL